MKKYLINNLDLPKKSYFKTDIANKNIYNILNNSLSFLNYQLTYFLLKLLETYNENYLEKFILNLNRIRYSLNLNENTTSFSNEIIKIFEKNKIYPD
jgi:hypothetical protein